MVVVNGDAELVVEPERLSPDHTSEPEAVAAVHHLGLGADVQYVLLFIQRPDVLTWKRKNRAAVVTHAITAVTVGSGGVA